MSPIEEVTDAIMTWPAPSAIARQRAMLALQKLQQERTQMVNQIKKAQESALKSELDKTDATE